MIMKTRGQVQIPIKNKGKVKKALNVSIRQLWSIYTCKHGTWEELPPFDLGHSIHSPSFQSRVGRRSHDLTTKVSPLTAEKRWEIIFFTIIIPNVENITLNKKFNVFDDQYG